MYAPHVEHAVSAILKGQAGGHLSGRKRSRIATFRKGILSLTITALLDRSLAGLQRRSDRLARRKALSRAKGRPGLAATLLASRAQEAELLVRHYRRRPADLPFGGDGWGLNGWSFHR